MTELILGGTGSGKTATITKRILADLKEGKKVILLVPEQAALSTESAVCSEAQRLGISQLNLEVLNFKRLCDRIFREFGGISYNSVTPGARSLIMWDALFSSAKYLSFFDKALEDADRLIPSMLTLISEFKAYDISAEMLAKAAEEAKDENVKLSSKLSDLSLIYSAYSSLLCDRFTDPLDDLSRAAEILKTNNFFSAANLYVDSFTRFTPQQYNVLRAAVAQADNSVFTLCLREDPNSFSFEGVKETKKKLLSMFREKPVITVLHTNERYKAAELSFIEKNLWNYKDEEVFTSHTDTISSAICSDPYAEAEYVSADILSKVRNGSRYRDFAVIARDINRYDGIIDAIFEKNGLPCRIFDKIELSEKPIFKLIRSALNIKIHNWSTDDVMVYLKTGLTDVGTDECYKLESYVNTWGIRGSQWRCEGKWFMNPDGYSDVLTDEGARLLQEVNEIRIKVVRPLEKLHECLDGSYTVSDICRALYYFTTELGIPNKAAESGSDDEIRLWNCFSDALDTMVDVIPDRKMSAKLFLGLFSIIIQQSNIGTLPATVDEITVGSADHLRAENIKHAYVIGVNEEIFPALNKEAPFFSDDEKAELEGYGINLSPTSDISAYDELFYAYSAFSLPSESLNVICSYNDINGTPLRPSVAFERLKLLFPNADHYDRGNFDYEKLIQNKNSAIEHLNNLTDKEQIEALKRYYESDPAYAFLLPEKSQPLVTEEETLDAETASMIFPGDMSLTQSRLDRYVLCAFSYHCQYVLKLKESKKADFRPSDTGTLIHRVLEKFFAELSGEEKIPQISDDELDRRINTILNDYLGSIFGKDSQSVISSRAMQLFKRLNRTLKILIRNLLNEFSQSEFLPRFFEMPIDNSGNEGTVAPLKIPLPDGTNAYIYGTADRVDVCKKGDDVYVRVVDYKTGAKKFSLSDIAMGLNLQMLIYLFSIWKDQNGAFKRALKTDGNIIPAGVLYFEARSSTVNAELDTSPSEIYSMAEDSLKRNGLLISDQEILELMEKKLSGKYIPVTVNKSGLLSASTRSLSLASLEDMGKLLNSITETVSRLATEIKAGNALCSPLKDGKHDGCTYCPHKAVCRNPAAFIEKKY